ncbi:MAG: hypothetical protein LBB88_00920 [Planctomycetaceae bacterium]|nr:hypothetical protein [Planctomycetaceae bacterium]
MSASNLNANEPLDKTIDSRLDAACTVLFKTDFWFSILLLLIFLFTGFFLAVIADHWLFPDGMNVTLRFIIFLAIISFAVFFTYRRIVPLFLYPINPVYAAQILENNSSSAQNAIINWITLKRERIERGKVASDKLGEKMLEGLTRSAAENINAVKTDTIINKTGINICIAALVIIVTILIFYLCFSPKNPIQSFARIVFPFMSIEPPQAVQFLDVQPQNTTALQGEHLTVSAKVIGKSKSPVYVFFSTDDGRAVKQAAPMNKISNDNAGNFWNKNQSAKFETTFPPNKQGFVCGIDYWIQQDNSKSEKYRVEVRPVATIEIESLKYKYPEYTGLDDSIIKDNSDIRAVEGSEVTVSAKSTMPLAQAEITYDKKNTKTNNPPKIKMQIDSNNPTITTANILLKDFSTNNSADNSTNNLTAESDSTELSDEIVNYFTINATDKDGYKSRRSGTFRQEIIRDKTPLIQWSDDAENLKEVAQIDLPLNAEIELPVQAEDPDFALRYLRIKYKVTSTNKTNKQIKSTELLQSPIAGATKHKGQIKKAAKFRPSQYQLNVGDTVDVWGETIDTKLPTPNAAETRHITIRIIKKQENNNNEKIQNNTEKSNQPQEKISTEKNQNENENKNKEEKQQNNDPNNDQQNENKQLEKNNQNSEENGENQNKENKTEKNNAKNPENSDNSENEKKESIDPETQSADAMQKIVDQMKKEKWQPNSEQDKNNQQEQDSQKQNQNNNDNKSNDSKNKNNNANNNDDEKSTNKNEMKNNQNKPDDKNDKNENDQNLQNEKSTDNQQNKSDDKNKSNDSNDSNESNDNKAENSGDNGKSQNNNQQNNNGNNNGEQSQKSNNDSNANASKTEKEINSNNENNSNQNRDSQDSQNNQQNNSSDNAKNTNADRNKNVDKNNIDNKTNDSNNNENNNKNETKNETKSNGKDNNSQDNAKKNNATKNDQPVDPNDNDKRERDDSISNSKSKQLKNEGNDSANPKDTNLNQTKNEDSRSESKSESGSKTTSKQNNGNNNQKNEIGENSDSENTEKSNGESNDKSNDKNAKNEKNNSNALEKKSDSRDKTTDNLKSSNNSTDKSEGNSPDKSTGNSADKSNGKSEGNFADKQPVDSSKVKSGEGVAGGNTGRDGIGGNNSSIESDEARREFTEKNVNLALDYLQDQLDKENPNKELLNELGWTEKQLRDFHKKWKSMNENAKKNNEDTKSNEAWKNALKSFNIRPENNKTKLKANKSTTIDDIKKSQSTNLAPPKSFQQKFQQYTKGIGE